MQIEYENSLCAFLDVLGFKNLVISDKKKDKEKLERYYSAVDNMKRYFGQINSKANIKLLSISDSILLSYNLTENRFDNIERCRNFILAIAKLQSELALHNIWLRGGVSIGKVCFEPDNSFIVGPGYIAAYELEQKSIYPRVIVDVGIVKEFQFKNIQSYIEEINKKNTGGLIFEDWSGDILYNWNDNSQLNAPLKQDVPLFIDYLSYAIEIGGNAKLIINHLNNNLLDGIAYDKYHWVASYLRNKSDVLVFKSNSKQKEKQHYIEIFNYIKELGVRNS